MSSGGAFYLIQQSNLQLQESLLDSNIAQLVAGCIVFRIKKAVDLRFLWFSGAIAGAGRVKLNLTSCFVSMNSAARFSTILLYNDDDLARFEIIAFFSLSFC